MDPEHKALNDRLREDSGTVQLNGDRLVGFLYDLLRDHLPPGKVEALVREAELCDPDVTYSNGWLARYAENLAGRLRKE